jgi:hypothetical protein
MWRYAGLVFTHHDGIHMRYYTRDQFRREDGRRQVETVLLKLFSRGKHWEMISFLPVHMYSCVCENSVPMFIFLIF